MRMPVNSFKFFRCPVTGGERIVAALLAIVFILITSCTPSKQFMMKKSRQVGADKSYVRVLIKNSDGRVLISSTARMRIMELKTQAVKYDGKGRKVFFEPEGIVQPVVIESWESPLIVDNRPYRGSLELHSILGRIHVINVVRMDEYLYGVVPSEITCTWNYEALKAQAVAARTYTYYHIMHKKDVLYDLDATTNFQVYNGISAEKENTNRAVDETTGEVAAYGNEPILSYFHSTCGGKTSDDRLVWKGNDLPYLKSVKCDWCKDSTKYSWEERLTLHEIRSSLKKTNRGVGAIQGVAFRRNNGRVFTVVIRHQNGAIKMSGNDFRLLFPPMKVKSLLFEARKTREGLVLHGHGWGHGVGMCQWGARGKAESGEKYDQILKYYYKGISIIRINGSPKDTMRLTSVPATGRKK